MWLGANGGALVDKLATGAPYRLLRDELPRDHTARRQGRPRDVLVLNGDVLVALRVTGGLRPEVKKDADSRDEHSDGCHREIYGL